MHTIVIDPGHGGIATAGRSTPFGGRGPGGSLEKDITLRLADRVARHLGGAAALTRATDVNLPLARRAEVARRSGARVFVSIHASPRVAGYGGSEVFFHPLADTPSRELAGTVHRALARVGAAAAPRAEQMAILTPSFHVAGTAACLVEVDDLASPDGERRLCDAASMDRLAEAIASAIRAHLAEGRFGSAGDGLMSCTLSAPCPRCLSSQPMEAPWSRELQDPDATTMRAAFDESRRTLRLARSAMHQLRTGLRTTGNPRNDFERRVLISVGRWLHAPTSPSNADRAAVLSTLDSAIDLVDRNLALRTAAGGDPQMRHVTGTFHARTYGDIERGIDCGDTFFNPDGPNCRRDVITHEMFHFVGLHHGGGTANAATPRASITTSAQALDSADNMAQLVSELMDGRTDACTRNGD
jgi:hypothetical protein